MKKWFSRILLKLLGWRIEGERPEHTRFVVIAAPHTSNWDFPMMLLFAAALDVRINWMAKHSLFFPPMGWIMKAMGGIPVVRHRNTNMVDTSIELFREQDELALTVPAEGTRSRVEYWKSGFYHIAHGAGVPIIPSYLDYGQKRGGFGPALFTSGNIEKDMETFRDFYSPMKGKHPEDFGPVRVKPSQDKD